jgi:rubrerythrin
MDIFAFAEQFEIEGEKIYRECAREAEQEGMKSIFTMLADAELRHLATIRAMRDKEPTTPVEIPILMQANVLMRKFGSNKGALRAAESQIDLYAQATAQENCSEEFYDAQAKAAVSENDRRIFRALAAEEHAHYLVMDTILWLVGHSEARLENAEFNQPVWE